MNFMKRPILAIALMLLLAVPASAQDVLKDILKTSSAIAKDTTQNINDRKIAIFKVDELNYMKSKVTPDILANSKDMAFFNKKIKMLNDQSQPMKLSCDFSLNREAEVKAKNK